MHPTLALRYTLGMLLFSVALAVPFLVSAQEDLQASVRAAIMADPRTANLSEAQIEAMVATLSQHAQAQGVTPADIAWRPAEDIQAQSSNVFCGSFPAYLCTISASYGFLGPDYIWPLWLGISSLLLFLILQLRRHHGHVAFAPTPSASTAFTPPAPSMGQNLQNQ